MPAVDLRELVGSPSRLSGELSTRAKFHPLHESIPQSLQYTSPGAKPVLLPVSGSGFHRLKGQISSAVIPGVDESFWEEAVISLLSEGFITQRHPSTANDSPDGTSLAATDAARTRSVLLARVFRGQDEKFDGETFSFARFGGVGVLTVMSAADDAKRIQDAWLHVEWAQSTQMMLRALERMAGVSPPLSKTTRATTILVGDALWEDSPGIATALERTGAITGAKVTIHRASSDRAGILRKELSRSQPSRLFLIGQGIPESITGDFAARRGTNELYISQADTVVDAVDWFREVMPSLMGIGPALMRHPVVEPISGRLPLPVKIPVECLHHGNDVYVKDGHDGRWWSRDWARHGQNKKSEFKTFRRSNNELLWEGDHNADGSLITEKHKSDEGASIAVSECDPCPHPHSHLR